MNCPKCGAAQPDGGVECTACGVVFQRFRASQERLRPEVPSSVEADPGPVSGALTPDDSIRIPQPAVIAAVVIFVILGISWTVHRHRNRTAIELTQAQAGNDLLNEINQKGIEARRNAGQSSRPGATMTTTSVSSTLPPDLTEDDVKRIISAASEMQASSTVTLPKSFAKHLYDWTLDQYPALFGAVRDGLVEFDPPMDIHTSGRHTPPNFAQYPETELVHVTSRGRMLGIDDGGGSDYTAQLGGRHVKSLLWESATGSQVYVTFDWEFDGELGNSLGHDPIDRRGRATLAKDGGWRVASVSLSLSQQ